MYDWTAFCNTPLHNEILDGWEILIANPNLKERDYHHYLFKNPAIFLAPLESYLVISKLKLGAEYETDFVVVKEGYSDGTEYELIEIESPHDKLFDSSGKLTAKFNSALQQIRDWKRLLSNDKSYFKKVFPTTTTRVANNSKLTFKIIIGRRSNNAENIEKRKQIAEENNVEIISFDRITDMARGRSMFFNEAQIYAGQMKGKDSSKKIELANPFYECTTHSEWTKICRGGDKHFYSNMLDEILGIRRYNNNFEKFKRQILNERI